MRFSVQSLAPGLWQPPLSVQSRGQEDRAWGYWAAVHEAAMYPHSLELHPKQHSQQGREGICPSALC